MPDLPTFALHKSMLPRGQEPGRHSRGQHALVDTVRNASAESSSCVTKKQKHVQYNTRTTHEKKNESIKTSEPQSDTHNDMATDVPQDKSQQGAFNPETGEFNWDCSCLGGMAHGLCGEKFKSAFSYFMLSTDEPKGMNWIDQFKYVDHQNIHMYVPATDVTPE